MSKDKDSKTWKKVLDLRRELNVTPYRATFKGDQLPPKQDMNTLRAIKRHELLRKKGMEDG